MPMLETDQAGRVLTVRMSNPPRNFMTGRMVAELDELIGRADEDASISAVVLTGAMDGVLVTPRLAVSRPRQSHAVWREGNALAKYRRAGNPGARERRARRKSPVLRRRAARGADRERRDRSCRSDRNGVAADPGGGPT